MKIKSYSTKSGNALLIALIISLIIITLLTSYICIDKLLFKQGSIESEKGSENQNNTTSNLENDITDNKGSNIDNANLNTSNSINDKTDSNNIDINENQNLKFYYYATKQEDSEYSSHRYSLTLAYVDNTHGVFSIKSLGQLESGDAHGYFRIENNKLLLSFGPFVNDNDLSNEEYIFSELKATLEDNVVQENYKTCTLDYSDDKLQIGNFTFYKVN